jgi:Tol biopolymer transport system component
VIWSPDGLRLAFSSFKNGNRDVVVKNASGLGEETPLLDSTNREVLEDWSDDGRYIVYGLDAGPNPTPAQDLYALPLFGDRKPFPIVQSPFQENEAQFSFDGKWLAYSSNESGRFQVYVLSFPALDQKRQISTNGGSQPQWRRDGKELYYLAPDGKLMAVNMTAGAEIDSGTPRELFDTELTLSPLQDQYRVTPDGQRFLVLKPISEATPTPITVVVNWTARLKK